MRNIMTRNAVMIAAVLLLFGCSAIVEPVALRGVAPDLEQRHAEQRAQRWPNIQRVIRRRLS